jgi:hypothetical protein
MFDYTIKLGALGFIMYIIISFEGTVLNYSLLDYNNLLYNFSITQYNQTIQLIFFLFILNLDNISLLVLILFNLYYPSKYISESKINNKDETCIDMVAFDVDGHAYNNTHSVKNIIECELLNAFIIVCHNSSDKIQETIESILLKVPPHLIYVSDNGSNDQEIKKMETICKNMNVKYLILPYGNKTKSQFATANVIKINEPYVKYVTCIDDDTHLPSNWNFKHVKEHHFDINSNIVCVPFPLTIKNQVNFASSCENFEYLLAGHSRIAQSKIGTTLFGSGGFSVWKLDVFLEVILHHNTVFNGEDFQLGMICHKSYGEKWLTNIKKWDFCPIMNTCEHIFVKTIAPIHWFHASDIPLFGNLFHKCDCGEGSLYKQRARGWDLTRHRFLFSYLQVLFSKTNLCWPAIWVKILYFNEIIMVLNDWASIIYIFIFGIIRNQWIQLFRGFIITICWSLPLIIIANYLILRRFKIPIFVVFLYTVLYKLPMNTLIKIDCMFYNFIVYSGIKNPKKLMSQLKHQNVFNVYTEYWRRYILKKSNTSDNYTVETIVDSMIDSIHSIDTEKLNSHLNSHLNISPTILPNKQRRGHIYKKLNINANSHINSNIYTDNGIIIDKQLSSDVLELNELDANKPDLKELDSNELDSNELDSNELDSNELDSKMNTHYEPNTILNLESIHISPNIKPPDIPGRYRTSSTNGSIISSLYIITHNGRSLSHTSGSHSDTKSQFSMKSDN